jgi:hypothetical protein
MGYFYLAFSKEETGAEILRNLLNEGWGFKPEQIGSVFLKVRMHDTHLRGLVITQSGEFQTQVSIQQVWVGPEIAFLTRSRDLTLRNKDQDSALNYWARLFIRKINTCWLSERQYICIVIKQQSA